MKAQHLSKRRIAILTAIVSCLFVLLFPGLSSSQPSNLRFGQVSLEQGISSDVVMSVAQTPDGFIWFGTDAGLNRWDGYMCTVFKHVPSDSNSLPDNSIQDLFVDRAGVLWIGMYQNLATYDRHTGKFKNVLFLPAVSPLLKGMYVNKIGEDSHGILWLATTGGLIRYEPDSRSVHFFRVPTQFGDESYTNHGNALVIDKFDRVWFGSNELFSFSEEREEFSHTHLALPPQDVLRSINSLMIDRDGFLWIGGVGKKLVRFHPATGTTETFPIDILLDGKSYVQVVYSLLQDKRGLIWAGCFSALHFYDPASGTFSEYTPRMGDPLAIRSLKVQDLFEDKAGTVWLGTSGGGVSSFHHYHQRFKTLKVRNEAPRDSTINSIVSLQPGRDSTLFMALEITGIARYDRKTGTVELVSYKPGEWHARPIYPMSIAQSPDGDLWIGDGGGAGVVEYNVAKKIFGLHPVPSANVKSFTSLSISKIFVDREGDVWAGPGGYGRAYLLKHNVQQFEMIALDDYRAFGSTSCIAQDRSGILWFSHAPSRYRLISFNKVTGAIHRYPLREHDSTITWNGGVNHIHQDEEGYLWLATNGDGMLRFDPRDGTSIQFTERDGLASDFVNAIVPDTSGNLWVSTTRGISRLSLQTRRFKNFDPGDGLQGYSFFPGSAARSSDGTLWFGGDNGVTYFNPDSIRDNAVAPDVLLTDFRIGDRSVRGDTLISFLRSVHLFPGQDFFSFEFLGLSSILPERERYAYQLEGFDPDWIQAGTRRYASYTHLDPGAYTFRVKASNNDGVWNEHPATIAVIVHPAFWQTWWFRLLAVLAIAAMTYAFYRYRVQQLLKLERLRNRIAGDLHDDVGTHIGSIVMASQIMERKLRLTDEERQQIRDLGSSASQAQEMMRDIVWMLNPKNDTLDHFILKLKSEAPRLLGELLCTFEVPDGTLMDRVGLDFKRNVFMIYKELLHNISKHAGARAVLVHIGQTEGNFVLRVRDDGKGFDESSPGAGTGLASLRKRAEILGGILAIQTTSGKGTDITLSVPLAQMRTTGKH